MFEYIDINSNNVMLSKLEKKKEELDKEIEVDIKLNFKNVLVSFPENTSDEDMKILGDIVLEKLKKKYPYSCVKLLYDNNPNDVFNTINKLYLMTLYMIDTLYLFSDWRNHRNCNSNYLIAKENNLEIIEEGINNG